MLADQYQRPYLDSSTFISWVKMEVIKGVERGKIIAHVLTLAEQGMFSIFTSTITLAEVHERRSQPSLSSNQDVRILAFFEHDYIKLIDVDRRIGEHANELCRQHGLYPNDAIHLASALRGGCDVLLAWDDRFVRVQDPALRIEEPRIIGQQTFQFPRGNEGESG